MGKVEMTLEEYNRLIEAFSQQDPIASVINTGRLNASLGGKVPKAKKKRGPSAYNRRYKVEYAKQKKKHPRMKMPALAKKTHKALKRRGKK